MKPGVPQPQPPSTPSTDGLLLRASPGQLEALGALARTGSVKEAGHALGIGQAALKNRLAELRQANAGATNVQLAYRLGRLEEGE